MKFLRLALLASVLLAPAAAQDELSSADAIALRNQILQLQAQVQALQSAQANGQYQGGGAPAAAQNAPQAAPNNDMVAQLLSRVSNLEDQVRTLNGEIDQLNNQVKQQNQQFTKQIGDINFQLQGGQGQPAGQSPAGGAAPAAGNGPTSLNNAPAAAPDNGNPNGTSNLPTGTLGTLPAGQNPYPDSNQSSAPQAAAQPAAPPPAPAAPSAQDVLQRGIDALGRKDYPAAEKAARSVLSTNHDSPAGYDAQLLLARSLAGRRQWQDAVLAYDETYKRARFGSHAQDARLGEARSLLNLGDNGAACGALNLFTKQFPNPRADLQQSYTSLRAKACNG